MYGNKEETQYNCAAGFFGLGRLEQSSCGLGFYNGDGNTFNWTRCHLKTDDADGAGTDAWMGKLNDTCNFESGGNKVYSQENVHKMNGPFDLTYGMENTDWKQCAADSDFKTTPTGHRAKCALGYFDGKKFPENTTPCFFSVDDPDWACRRSVGFRQDSKMSLSKPSQATYSMKKMIEKDRKCGALKRRAVCEMGYSNGVKLPDFSTRCRKRLDNFGDACKEAYGQEYFPIPVEDDKKLGCKLPLTAARAVCRKDRDIKLNTEFTNAAYEIAGQQCTWPGLANTDMTCSHYYGPNYQHVGWSKDVKLIDGKKGKNGCHTTFRKGRCKKVRELKDMKNQVCLWTNRSCGGRKCKDRCPTGWTALNPEKKCGYSGWLGTPNKANGESQSCLCCKDKDDSDGSKPDDTNLYFNAINDTTGQVKDKKLEIGMQPLL